MASAMFPLGLTAVLSGAWLVDCAVQNRAPVDTFVKILQNPGKYGEILDAAEGHGFDPSPPVVPPGEDEPYTPPGGGGGGGRGKAVAFARAQIGKAYCWGGEGPKCFDCSGLTQAAHAAAGIKIPRVVTDQLRHGRPVAKANLQPGDLISPYRFPTHIVMYSGGGRIIEAPRTGVPIHEVPMYGFQQAVTYFK